jgi:hypothetical protein
MQPCLSQAHSPLIVFKRNHDETLERLLKREQTRFLEFAATDELRIKSNDTVEKSHLQTLNSLTLPSRCYAVEFNDESVTITATK